MRNFHFNSTTTRNQFGFQENISCNMNSILQISFNFIENIFGSSTKQNCASFGIFAFFNKGKVFITNFSYFKESCTSSNIFLSDFISTADNGGTAGTSNTKVVSFTKPPDDCDVSLKTKDYFYYETVQN